MNQRLSVANIDAALAVVAPAMPSITIQSGSSTRRQRPNRTPRMPTPISAMSQVRMWAHRAQGMPSGEDGK
ncbi:hypothetical protein D3C84_1108900 [compost metagenome]